MQLRAPILLAALVALAGPAARADEPSTDAAKVHFQAGALHYKQGQYPQAIEEFKAADRLRPSPILSYNIAQCYEKMADLGKARTYYQEYLQRSPEATDRSAIEATIASIDAQLAEARAKERVPEVLVMPAPPLAAAAAPVATVTAPPPSRNHTVSTVLFIVGGAGLATGVGLNIGSNSAANDLKNLSPPNHDQAQSLYDQSQNLWTGAVIGYVAGGAILAGGLIALLIENGGHSPAGATQ